MKLKNIILITLTTIVLTSCYTANQISKFSSENIELGIDKNLFIKRYGKPFNKEISAQLQISVAYFCSIGLYFLV